MKRVKYKMKEYNKFIISYKRKPEDRSVQDIQLILDYFTRNNEYKKINEMMTQFPVSILKKIYNKDSSKYKCIRDWSIHSGVYIDSSDKILGEIYKKYFTEDFNYKILYHSRNANDIELAIKKIKEGDKALNESMKNIFSDEYTDILLYKIKSSRKEILKNLLFRLYEITND